MFYVVCPCCDSRVEVPTDSVGESRTDLFNVIVCDLCDASFDYDEDDISEQDERVVG
jgi:hypothetical protein